MTNEQQKFATLAESKPTREWSSPVSVNLLLNDRALFAALRKRLHVEREKVGIALSRTATKGERRQKYSWRMVEVFDLGKYRALNDSERRLKSQATQMFMRWQEK